MTAVADPRADRLRGVARSGGIGLIGAVASSVLGFLLVVVVSRGLGAHGAGAFAVAVAAAMTLTVAGRLGVDTALVRTLPRLRELGRDADVRTAVIAALAPVCVGATLLGAALWTLAPTAAGYLLPDAPAGVATWLLRTAAVAVPLGAAGYVALAATRGLGTIVPLTVVESIAKPAARCVAVGAALMLGAGAIGATAAWTVAAALGAALGVGALVRSLRRFPAGASDARGTRRELWAFAAPRGVAALCEIAGMHAGVLLTAAFAGAAAAGVFNATLRLALAGTLALQALRLAVAPTISRLLTAGDVHGVEHLHRASATWIVLLSFPPYLLCAAWPGTALALFGADFRAGAPALAVLAAALLVNLATGNVATVLLMSGRSGLTLAITAGSLALAILLTIALAPVYGVLGAAIAKAASVVFENVAVLLAVRRTVGVRTVSRPLLAAAALAVVCFAAPALIARLVAPTAGWAVALAGAGCYAAAVWRLRRPFELAALSAVVPGPLRRGGARVADGPHKKG